MYDKKDFAATRAMTLDMIHNKKTTEQIMGILGAGDPMQTIPKAAATIDMQVQQAYAKKGKPLSLENTLANAVIIGAELVELGNAAGLLEITDREAPAVLEKSAQAIVKQGLKSGNIDPVELQQLSDEGMPEQLKAAGLENESTPNEKDEMVAMEQYADQRVSRDRAQRQPQQQGGMLNGQL